VKFNQVISSDNRLLAALPRVDYKRLMMSGELVELVLNDLIDKAGDKVLHVYFPIKSIISLMKHVDGDKSLEVGMIGNEGMLGSTLLLGVDTTPFTSVVQKAGSALRIPVKEFLKEFEKSFMMQRQFKRYIKVLFSQLVQNAACTRFHVVEARLARLLLMIKDRAQSQSFHITQESLAQMLGVRRVGVTKAAGALQHKHLISYSRGDVLIHDNTGLEKSSCSCYQTDNETYQRILLD
jgi:CRP-like cAMP-binding protein